MDRASSSIAYSFSETAANCADGSLTIQSPSDRSGAFKFTTAFHYGITCILQHLTDQLLVWLESGNAAVLRLLASISDAALQIYNAQFQARQLVGAWCHRFLMHDC